MNRELRPRKNYPTYSPILGYEVEQESGPIAGPSRLPGDAFIEDGDSGSEFAPEGSADETLVLGLLATPVTRKQQQEDEPPASFAPVSNLKRKGKARLQKGGTETPSKTNGLSRLSNRQMYTLPTPSVHHRHRAVALISRAGRVERLESPPPLFGQAKTIPTNNFTQSSLVTDRICKAWGYNVGSGPLWELVEDRGWYKEALPHESDMEKEANRRPIVYSAHQVMTGWVVLNSIDAFPYLPSDIVTTDEGFLKPPPSVACFLGPFGRQSRTEMNMFDTRKMSDFIPESKAHILNAGAPVWGLDWCPIHPKDRPHRSYKQYLAVAPFPSRSFSPEIGFKVLRPSNACIQIWALRPLHPVQVNGPVAITGTQEHDSGEMKCEMVLCLNGGPAHEIKWCPLPSHDALSESNTIRPRKLGILAGTFLDGSLSLYAVPDPLDVTPADTDVSQPIFVKIPEPLVRIELEESACWSLDWANSEVIAVGTTNGVIAVYDIGQVLRTCRNSSTCPNTIRAILPTHYITVHQSAIRAIAWIRAPTTSASGEPRTNEDPTVISSGGYDGVECLTDIREGTGCVMNRTRDVINAMVFSPFAGGPITIDHENIVKTYSASPSMLGRGHTLFEPSGPVWSVNASDYHPQLAVGCSDGSCLTTNTLRSTRRGGSVPFFVHKIYQMDYNRNTGEFRMLERFLPQQTQDKPISAAAKVQTQQNDVGKNNSSAWPQQVGIHRVAWNSGNGLGAAGMLASATASGICRVDWLSGRWMKGKIPYGSIANVRKELDADDMDVDISLSDE